MKVRQARDAYLAENGFSVESYDDAWTSATFFGIFDFRVPNTPRHRIGIMHHDLLHVVTGYGTDQVGEGEISIWELRRDLRCLGPYVGSIVVAGAAFGFLLAPRRMIRAWKAAGRGPSLHAHRGSYEALLELDVATLREQLDVPPDGLATGPRKLHARAPHLNA